MNEVMSERGLEATIGEVVIEVKWQKNGSQIKEDMGYCRDS